MQPIEILKKKKINTNKNLFWIKHDFSKKLYFYMIF